MASVIAITSLKAKNSPKMMMTTWECIAPALLDQYPIWCWQPWLLYDNSYCNADAMMEAEACPPILFDNRVENRYWKRPHLQ